MVHCKSWRLQLLTDLYPVLGLRTKGIQWATLVESAEGDSWPNFFPTSFVFQECTYCLVGPSGTISSVTLLSIYLAKSRAGWWLIRFEGIVPASNDASPRVFGYDLRMVEFKWLIRRCNMKILGCPWRKCNQFPSNILASCFCNSSQQNCKNACHLFRSGKQTQVDHTSLKSSKSVLRSVTIELPLS